MFDRLEEREWIIRTRCDEEPRAVLVELSGSGLALLGRLSSRLMNAESGDWAICRRPS
jgi:DNA-binding MarR family transcriptional regulator